MKSPYFLALVLLVGTAFPVAAADSNRWGLFESLDWAARWAYLQDQPEAQADSAFLLQALALADSDRIESGTEMEINHKKSIALAAIRSLAEHPVEGAAAAISRIPRQYKDPLLRGEAWVALAKLKDRDSIPGMVRTLAAINDSGLRSRAEEIQAAYLVQALGVYQAPEAFRTLWAASLGWYAPSSGVKAQARRTLAALVPDTEKATLDLLANDEDLGFREAVFQAVVDQGDAQASARAASAVLSTLVRQQPRDKADQERAVRVTLLALLAAQKSSAPPVDLVPSLKLILLRADSQETTTQTVRLLGKIDDTGALSLLVSTLSTYNAQQKAGTNKTADLLLVRELFQALAATGKAEARPPLNDALFAGYTPAMAREAQDALGKLPPN